MWRDDQTGERGSAYADTCLPWLVVGMATAQSEPLLRSLAQFGIAAAAQDGEPCMHSPVLCDRRDRALADRLLEKMAQRNAPLVFCNVALAEVRARLLSAGADDAVSARIAPCELAARMAVAARTWARAQGSLMLAGFTFDTGLRQVWWRGWRLPVMPREFDLLLELARHGGVAVSRQALLHSVWQTAFDPGTNSVEVHICKLRRHLASSGGDVQIETVKGRGYRLLTPLVSRG